MSEQFFLVNLAVALLAATAGGLAARAFRLPPLVGYIVAGILLGPRTPGFVTSAEAVLPVARIGVALLMFVVGVHFSLGELAAVRRIALGGGMLQIAGTVALGVPIGAALGWGVYGGLFLGCTLALSSTAVMMRVLEERGELGTGHGTAMLGILIVQDLSLVLMATLLPSLAVVMETPRSALPVLEALLRAAVAVAGTLVLASRGVPALLARVARTGSQELFLLVVVTICLGSAYLATRVGLSFELGAFLAGLVVSESDYAHQVFAQVRPVRDLFASLFFVSIGMLLDPSVLLRHAVPLAVVVAAILVGKAVIATSAISLMGAHGRTALLAGLGLAQIGEFSFVLAEAGQRRGLVSAELTQVVLAAAVITLLLAPFVYALGAPLYARLSQARLLAPLLHRVPYGEQVASALRPPVRAVVLGCGRVGRAVSEALRVQGISHVVVDFDPNAVARQRAHGIPVVYGDATSEVVLKAAGVERAELVVVALPEAEMTQMAVRTVRRLAPRVAIIARVHRGADIPRVRAAGADAVIHAEFEAATAMIRLGLDRLGFPDREVTAYLDALRQERYRELGGAPEAPRIEPGGPEPERAEREVRTG